MAGGLDSRHHTFLQAVLKRGPVSEKDALAIFKELFRSNSGNGFIPFLGAINKEFEFMQLEVKKAMNQYSGEQFYGIINTLPSKEAKLGTQYSQAQILFFTALMEAIVQDPLANGVISSTGALNIKLDPQSESQSNTQPTAAPVKMSMQAKEETISQLTADQLLSRNDDGSVGFGMKSFLELRSVFRSLEVPFCEFCNEAAIKAQLCCTRDCPRRVHVYCLTRISQSRKQRPKCSGCGTEWNLPFEKEVAKVEEEDNIVVPIATQEPVHKVGKKRRPTSKRSLAVAEDDDEEHLEAKAQEDENAAPNVSIGTLSKSRSTARSMLDSEEDEEDEMMNVKRCHRSTR